VSPVIDRGKAGVNICLLLKWLVVLLTVRYVKCGWQCWCGCES